MLKPRSALENKRIKSLLVVIWTFALGFIFRTGSTGIVQLVKPIELASIRVFVFLSLACF